MIIYSDKGQDNIYHSTAQMTSALLLLNSTVHDVKHLFYTELDMRVNAWLRGLVQAITEQEPGDLMVIHRGSLARPLPTHVCFERALMITHDQAFYESGGWTPEKTSLLHQRALHYCSTHSDTNKPKQAQEQQMLLQFLNTNNHTNTTTNSENFKKYAESIDASALSIFTACKQSANCNDLLVLVIQRKGARSIMNLDDVIHTLKHKLLPTKSNTSGANTKQVPDDNNNTNKNTNANNNTNNTNITDDTNTKSNCTTTRSFSSANVQLVELSGLSFCDQVRIWNHADIIVAAHGAGNINLLFANTKAILLEAMPHQLAQYYGGFAGAIAKSRGIQFRHLNGRLIVEDIESDMSYNENIGVVWDHATDEVCKQHLGVWKRENQYQSQVFSCLRYYRQQPILIDLDDMVETVRDLLCLN
eukprot:c11711_g1_i1.p1 GENE.c11711_g1_i1~~c11711_g1_i1.p1  ORF type:complete len:417 (-),score=98.91 c11711_g1_i1:194-1444(-)